MAKTFKGFTYQQTHQLLKEMGFTGPAQKDEMDAFLASSPSAASKLGRYNEIAKQRVEGGPMSGMGMNTGGSTTPEGYTNVSRITPDETTDNKNFPTDPDDLFPDYGVAPPGSEEQLLEGLSLIHI